MKKIWLLTLLSTALCAETVDYTVVGGGIVGALESYYFYKDAVKNGDDVRITIYEKGDGLSDTNTAYNIAPSLTIDEILSVVPRGKELVNKLAIPFDQPGGIRVDDVAGINDSPSAISFKNAVMLYANDPNHDDRTDTLLSLGRMSMDLWQQLYDEGDDEIKSILELANFHPCREPKLSAGRALHDGYRIDLIYGIPNAAAKAANMKADYDKYGYKNCNLLSPDEVVAIDPYLKDYCAQHSTGEAPRVWKQDAAALWRPGGCVDAYIFLTEIYAYLEKQLQNNFRIAFNKQVTSVILDEASVVTGLKFSDGTSISASSQYVFCPGEAIGTLQLLGFQEPAYAGFAGAALMLDIPAEPSYCKDFSHCMEVHNEGIVLAWQARAKEKSIFISVAGTKSFYGDVLPTKQENFAKNRNLVQLNMINEVLPEFISLACGYSTQGKCLTAEDLSLLEKKGIARRWAGRRAVAYDGFPTLGALYHNGNRVANARCTTHLGSGGVSFGPAVIAMSRQSFAPTNDPFVQKVLTYADSRRSP